MTPLLGRSLGLANPEGFFGPTKNVGPQNDNHNRGLDARATKKKPRGAGLKASATQPKDKAGWKPAPPGTG